MDGSTGSEPKGSTVDWFEQDSWLHNIQTLVLVILLVDQVIIETISNEPQLYKTPSRYYIFFSCLVAVNKTYVVPILFFVSGCAVPTYLDGKLFFKRLVIRVQCTFWCFLLSIIARTVIGRASQDIPDAPFYSTEVGRDISLFLPSLYILVVLLFDSVHCAVHMTWSRFFRTAPSISSTFRYRCAVVAAFLSLTTLRSIGYIYLPTIVTSFFPESVSEILHSHFPLQYLLSFSVGTQFTTLAPYVVIPCHPALALGASVVASIAGLAGLFRHFPSEMPSVMSFILSPSVATAPLSSDWKLAFAYSSWNTFSFILISTALISIFNSCEPRELRTENPALFIASISLQCFIPMWLAIGIAGKIAWIGDVTSRLVFLIAISLLLGVYGTVGLLFWPIFFMFGVVWCSVLWSWMTTDDPQEDTTNATKPSPEGDLDNSTPLDHIHWLDSLRNFLIALLVLERSILIVTSTTPGFDSSWSHPLLTLGMMVNRNFIVGGLCFVSGFAAHISKEHRSASSFRFLFKRTWKRAALACAYFLSGQLVNFFYGPWKCNDGVQDAVTPFYAVRIGKTALIDDPILYLMLILFLDYLYVLYDKLAGFLSPERRDQSINRFWLFFVITLSVHEGTQISTKKLIHSMEQNLPYPMIINSLFWPHAPMQYLAAYLVGVALPYFYPNIQKSTTTPSVPRLFIQFALVILGSWYFLSSLYTSYPLHIPRLIDMRLSPLRKFAQDPLEEEENLPSHYALWSTASFVFILFSLVKLFRRIGMARWGLERWMAYVQGLVHLFFVFSFAKYMPVGQIEGVVGRCARVFLGSLTCGYICAVGAAKGWTALEGILRGIRGQPKLDVEKRAEIELQ
jgi:hypothetical protein